MATRSTIAVQHADGTVSQIYAHWDGYLSHNGRILFEAYNTQERAEALVALGDISSLDRSIEQPAGHSFNKPVEGCTVFYGRDRGEEDTEARVFKDFKDYRENCQTEEYDYVFRNGTWYVSIYNRPLIDLHDALMEEEALDD